MLITKSVKLEINKGNIPYYKKFTDYNHIKIGDIVDIDIKYLAKANNSKITYVCDICGAEKETSYNSYCDPRRNKEKDVCKGICANEKRENTNMELYGVKNCFQNEGMKETAKETMLEKYGVDHNMKTEKCKSDRKETYIKNWGFDNPSKSDKIKKKKEETCLKNFGVKSPLQNRDVFKRNKLSGNQIHKYPKNKNITYQGTYELDFLDNYHHLINIEEPDFIINYIFENKEHKYHPDFYNKNNNLIIEIKSDYTYNREVDKNLTKRNACIEQGYNFLFVKNKNYLKLNRILKLLTI